MFARFRDLCVLNAKVLGQLGVICIGFIGSQCQRSSALFVDKTGQPISVSFLGDIWDICVPV